MTEPTFPTATILGYPRIGVRRELKRALESYWAGQSDATDVAEAAAQLRRRQRNRLRGLGLAPDTGAIPADFSYYDHVLDAACMAGAIPPRFAGLTGSQGRLDLAGYSTLARGRSDAPPLEMTKWFDTNYHYLVPEVSPHTVFHLADEAVIEQFREGLEVGITTRPVVLGPVSFLLLSKPVGDDDVAGGGAGRAPQAQAGFRPLERLEDLLGVYVDLLAHLEELGAPWVQLDEPALAVDTWHEPRDEVLAALARAYGRLSRRQETDGGGTGLFVPIAYGEAHDALPVLADAGVEAVGIDLARGTPPPPEMLQHLGDTQLVAGIVNGRNVWRNQLSHSLDELDALGQQLPHGGPQLSVTTSTPLLHVPYDVRLERAMDDELRSWLAFADQKIGEVLTLSQGLDQGRDTVADKVLGADLAIQRRDEDERVHRPEVQQRVAAVTDEDTHRASFTQRRDAQAAALQLPLLPTTTIGSFPQTREVRRARAAFRNGRLSENDYLKLIRAEITKVIALQEDIGLDVLVHGEAERNDMVQYFAEHLDGFAATEHGWVQSYGSRCTRPAILWGDVSRPEPITQQWSQYAASLTDKPLKGMLTGPVTILAWSFVRDDQPRADTAIQVALALRDEVRDLEAAGLAIIQVDEPALRELLPLRAEEQSAYLDWAVRAFRLATGAAGAATQIHTHLCYSEFGEVLGAIDALDADVTSIEAARSRMELLPELGEAGFARAVGPGVYDIHSPRVPSAEEMSELLAAASNSVPSELLWVNPDCGLKTRSYDEVTPALHNLIAAAQQQRNRLLPD